MYYWAISLLLLLASPVLAEDLLHAKLERQAETAVSARDWPKARVLYKKSLREAVRENDREAVLHLRKQISRLPVDPAVIAQLLEGERYDEAFKRLKEYLNYNSGDIWAMSLLGTVYEAIGQDALAEKLYKKAVSIEAKHPTPHYYYGRFLLLKKKQFRQALKELKKFRECLDPSLTVSEREKKMLLNERIQATQWIASIEDTVLGDTVEAFRELTTLVRVSKPNAEVLYSYGVLAMRLGKKQTAYDTFQRVIQLSSDPELVAQARQAIDLIRNVGSDGNRYTDPYS